MRDILDFYKQRPVLGAFLVVLALLIAGSLAVVTSGRPVLLVSFTLLLGLLVGGAIAFAQRPPREDEPDLDEPDFGA